MDPLRLYLLAGLILHKALWELMRMRAGASSGRFHPIKLVKIGLLAGLIGQLFLPSLLPVDGPVVLKWWGAVMFTAGLAIAIAGRVYLGGNWSNVEAGEVRPGHEVVSRGIYGFIRHPIYLGDVLLVGGFQLALESWLFLITLPLAIYVYRKAKREEGDLAGKLPAYENYQRSTAMFLSLSLVWPLWWAAILAATVPGLRYHVEFFQKAGPGQYKLMLALLPILLAGPLLWHWVRHKTGMIRFEPLGLSLLAAGILLLREPLAVLLAVLVAAACHVTGAAIFTRMGIRLPSLAARLAYPTALGLGLLALVLFAMGLAGLYRPVCFLPLLMPALLGWRRLWAAVQSIVEQCRGWATWPEQTNPLVGAAVFFAGAYLALAGLAVVLPATNGDGIRMHLSLAKAYWQAGRLFALPFIEYTYYPQSFEIQMTMLWGLGGQAAAQLLNPLYFALVLLAATAVGRQCGISKLACFLGITLMLTVPFLHWSGIAVKNDMAMVLYLLAALGLLIHDGSSGTLVAAAFLLGSAFAVKHVALFGAIPLGWLMFRFWLKQERKFVLALTLAIVFLGCCGGWYLRAWTATGNALHPSRTGDALPNTSNWAWKIQRITFTPWIVHFNGNWRFESPTSNPMGAALLMFTPVLFLVRRRGAGADRMVWTFIGIQLVHWMVVTGMIRYAIAPLMLVFVFLAARMELLDYSRRIMRLLSTGGMIWCGTFAFPITIILEMLPNQPAMLAGSIGKEELLRRELQPFGAMHFTAGATKKEDRIFSVGNWAVSYAAYPAQVNHIYRTERRYEARDLGEFLRHDYRFLILPQAGNLPELEKAASQKGALDRVYTDAYFNVYRTR